MSSTQEATYHGVKVLGLPVFEDQIRNMYEVETRGLGIHLQWTELDPALLKSVIEFELLASTE